MIKPIETAYGGCRFRSRLEARHAVFFDALGWPWEYEPQGFSLPSGNYLPDFRITPYPRRRGAVPVWFEVKAPGVPDDARWQELADASGELVVVSKGMHRSGDTCGRDHTAAVYDRVLDALSVELWMDIPASAWDAASGARFEHGENRAPRRRKRGRR